MNTVDNNEDSIPTKVVSAPLFEPCLYIQRYQVVSQILTQFDPQITKVADFGCAEGRFLRYLKKLPNLSEISCVDSDDSCLELCIEMARPIVYDYYGNRENELTINIYNGSVAAYDSRLVGVEAVTMIELIEHLHTDVLRKLPSNVFGFIKPRLVIVTTPNIEFNVFFPKLKFGQFRHYDHKFEFTRQEFANWCDGIVIDYPDYSYSLTGVGKINANVSHTQDPGFCTQIAIFRLCENQMNHNTTNSMSTHYTSRLPLNYMLKDSFHYPKVLEEMKEIEYINWDEVLTVKN